MFSTHPLIGKEVLTLIYSSFPRGSPWSSTAYTARSCCSMEYMEFLCPSRAGTKILGVLRPSAPVILTTVPNPSGVADTSNSNSSPAWEMPRALLYFTSMAAFAKVTCCPYPQSYACPLFISPYQRQRHHATWGIKVLPKPQIPTKVCTAFKFLMVVKLTPLSITASGTCVLPNQMTPKSLGAVPGP